MQSQPTPTPLPVSRSGICVVDGYGVRIRVARRRLVIEDGFGPYRRRAEFARATCPIKRLVLLGYTGYLSLEALRWLTDVGIGFVQLDPEGHVLTTSGGFGLDDPRLRRAQALARDTSTGTAISRYLLNLKLSGQAAVADSYGRPRSAQLIRQLALELNDANAPAELMVVEAAAASEYWQLWAPAEVNWIKRDQDRVPAHWKVIGDRSSPLANGPRVAASPAHAIWNYSYALLAAEATLACLAMGLDPGLGTLHADQKARDSLALDVCEAVRPAVDRHVLELVRGTVFRAADFVEGRNGSCRLTPALTHRFCELLPLWRRQLAPIAEHVAGMFAVSSGSGVVALPTNLSGTKRRTARALLHGTTKRRSQPKAPKAKPYCHSCGAAVGRDQRFCDQCRPAALAAASSVSIATARRKRMKLRAAGQDPATTEQVRTKLRASHIKRREEERTWDAQHGERPSPALFRERILPGLGGIPLSRLASATGLSISYLSEVRAGKKVPHSRWWDAIEQAVLTRT